MQLTALKCINKTISSRHISNTLENLKGMLPDKDSHPLSESSFPLRIDYNRWNSDITDKDKLKAISKAIDEKRVISFSCINIKGEEKYRIVEPLSLILKDFA